MFLVIYQLEIALRIQTKTNKQVEVNGSRFKTNLYISWKFLPYSCQEQLFQFTTLGCQVNQTTSGCIDICAAMKFINSHWARYTGKVQRNLARGLSDQLRANLCFGEIIHGLPALLYTPGEDNKAFIG